MNFQSYRELPGVNASSLKHMAVSPLHYQYNLRHDRPDTTAMAKGRAIHSASLEPDELPKRYVTWPDARRGKEWIAFKAAAESAGREILTTDEYDDVIACRDAVRSHPVAAQYLSAGRAEQTLEWTDAETGLACKARLDWMTHGGTVVDLKTARDISTRAFERQTHDLLYYVQAAHYVAGAGAARFVFIAVESNPPHDVRCGPLSDDALYAGEQERRRLLNLVADCTESGVWPGAFPSETEFDLPQWYYAAGERVLEGLA